MNYIDSNLQKDESVCYRGKIHPFIFIPGIFFMILGFLCFYGELIIWFVGLIVFLYGLSRLIDALIIYHCTEFAITNKRTIVKKGFIRRDVFELNNNKVESVNFNQNELGRLFNFGTVILRGTGAGENVIYYIF